MLPVPAPMAHAPAPVNSLERSGSPAFIFGKIPITANLINIFFFIKDQPLPDSRQYVVLWATQNSAAMKKCL
jgi:hypothetical protein